MFRGLDVNKGSHKVRDLVDAWHGQTRQTRASLAKTSNKSGKRCDTSHSEVIFLLIIICTDENIFLDTQERFAICENQ